MTAPAVSDLQIRHVWRGRELAQAQEKVLSTGFAALDAQLPGQGWPLGCLVEVLQAQPQQHVWQLLAPALAQCMREESGPVVLVAPPYEPFGPALQAQGLRPQQLLCVHADKPAQRLWAAEQALRCADVSAVLAWVPRAKAEELRRLQLCAQQNDRLLVAFRGIEAREQSSPARLRLLLQGTEQLEVSILKRRGPPLLQPVMLDAHPARLAALLAARKVRRAATPLPVEQVVSDVLDRAASLVR
ncbi:translesion DNA synthesis-associated protein ImuA [Ramlibacter sp. G-1-2-2]|uniref:Translesion DNA synthesis-associated protein ImuA n=1 Tax=Ramlibacter agri TaxID=2728837 RepID=A0A848H7K6_9BURK|nr:translesion DNA synthesis-associated protein ImuA [Ramlibacter agri]NML46467.1 translesion DNA synthesis-associated protein ImuA [Ramlibacter agri]